MSSTKDNDKRIKELRVQIQNKLDSLPKISKDFKTNLVLELEDNTYNLNVIPINVLQEKLIQLCAYHTVIHNPEISEYVKGYTIAGYTVDDWIYDIMKLIDIYNMQKTAKELKASLSKLDTLLSDTAKTEDFLDNLTELLKD